MTVQQPITQNAVSLHSEPESFQDYAYGELSAASLHTPGICFLPECSKAFNPTRDWQVHCCTACHLKTKAEMRKWGHKMAMALLTHQIGKYEKKDEAIRERTKSARRYVAHVQSEWMKSRKQRAELAVQR